MNENASENTDVKIRVVCPVCSKSGYIYLSRQGFSGSARGVSSVLISNSTICEHSYQIFVDKNGAVRGYETPDFELKMVIEEKEEVEEQVELGLRGAYQVIRSICGDETLCKCLRSGLINQEIFCISDNEYFLKFFKDIFNSILGKHYQDKIYVCSLKKYNAEYRKRVYGSDHQYAFVFNADLGAIIKQPYKKGFKSKNYYFESYLLDLINTSTKNPEETVKMVMTEVLKLLNTINEAKEKIDKKKIENKDDLEKFFQKKSGLKVKIKTDLLLDIFLKRFNININDLFDKMKVDKLSNMFL